MGIKGLTKLLAGNAPKAMKEQKLESYSGREIAIDASMSVYQFLVPPGLVASRHLTDGRINIVLGRRGTQMLTNEAGEVTSYVFDGTPPELKKQELAKRISKRADATIGLNEASQERHYEDCKRLLRLMGVPVIEAPCEAEAQCSALCKSDKVYAVALEDMDTLAFGAPRFVRHLMDSSSRKIPVMEFEVLEELNLTMDQFIDLCILSGCDYCDSIRGIGGLTALKLIRQHGSIERILENINKTRYQVPDDWAYQESRRLFKEPSVLTDDDQLELKWTDPNEEGMEKIKNSKNKLSRGRSESFFQPVVSRLAPAERVHGPLSFRSAFESVHAVLLKPMLWCMKAEKATINPNL
ncbi:flap endonuclease 1 [Phtheirospermum japonicum]|uniref:Flap endonuclease 1 n=1 Tax=Phtheirospermum japonicum TaxID=374723 RepID=A0A830CIU0_9LAMI|nr:flap endonuclease 1 [Phtheirospermum japonicum]